MSPVLAQFTCAILYGVLYLAHVNVLYLSVLSNLFVICIQHVYKTKSICIQLYVYKNTD